MDHTVSVRDDLDLRKIAESGQCFRVREFPDGTFRFVTGTSILYILPLGGGKYDVSCTGAEWKKIWRPYFDLGRSYAAVRRAIDPADTFLRAAAKEGKGIRILRQDPWETLVTFILSQRKSIPAIRACVETLAERCGTRTETEREVLHLFPTPEQLAPLDEAALRECRLGYRAPYVADAVQRSLAGRLDPSVLSQRNDEELLAELMTVKGVGIKVAGCTALFAYGRTAMAPVDTWIRQIMENVYGGSDPFAAGGDAAGILQQYAFHYAVHHKQELRSLRDL